MIERFEKQIDVLGNSKPSTIITEESLLEIEHKFYENGDPILVGDMILYGMLETVEGEYVKTFKLIRLNERHLYLYICVDDSDSIVPLIKKVEFKFLK